VTPKEKVVSYEMTVKEGSESGAKRDWWRWRESNPRPKVPLVSIYKLRTVI